MVFTFLLCFISIYYRNVTEIVFAVFAVVQGHYHLSKLCSLLHIKWLFFSALLFFFYFSGKNFSRYSVLTERPIVSLMRLQALLQCTKWLDILYCLHCISISISFLFHCCTAQQRFDMCSTIRSNFSRTEHERRFNKLAFVSHRPFHSYPHPIYSALMLVVVKRKPIHSYTFAQHTHRKRNTLRTAQH